MTSVVWLGCSQVVIFYSTLTGVVELGQQAWNPKAIHYSVADQNRKARGRRIILSSFDERKKQGNLPVDLIWKVELFTWRRRVEKWLDGWPRALKIFGTFVDEIRRCTRLVYQFVCRWARLRLVRWLDLALGAFQRHSSLRLRFLASMASSESQFLTSSGPRSTASFQESHFIKTDVISISIWSA